MTTNSDTENLRTIYPLWRFFFSLFRYSTLFGVLVIPFFLLMMIAVSLEFNWVFIVFPFLALFNRDFADGSFRGGMNDTITLLWPLVLLFSILALIFKWIIRRTTGKNFTISLKQKFFILISIITVIHIAAAFVLQEESGDNDFYFIVGFFYIISFVSTLFYMGLEVLLKFTDSAVQRKLASH